MNRLDEYFLNYKNPYEQGVPFKKTSTYQADKGIVNTLDWTFGFEDLVKKGAWTQEELDYFYENPYEVWENTKKKSRG